MTLTIQFDLPAELEEKLLAETPDIASAVKEAYAVEMFRKEKIGHYELSCLLGLDRFETDAYLQRNKIYEQSLTMEDLEADIDTLNRVLGPVKKD